LTEKVLSLGPLSNKLKHPLCVIEETFESMAPSLYPCLAPTWTPVILIEKNGPEQMGRITNKQ